MHFIIHFLIQLFKYVTYSKFEPRTWLATLITTFCVSFVVLLHPINLEFVPIKDRLQKSIIPLYFWSVSPPNVFSHHI